MAIFTKDNCNISYRDCEILSIDFIGIAKTYVVTLKYYSGNAVWCELFDEWGDGENGDSKLTLRPTEKYIIIMHNADETGTKPLVCEHMFDNQNDANKFAYNLNCYYRVVTLKAEEWEKQ